MDGRRAYYSLSLPLSTSLDGTATDKKNYGIYGVFGRKRNKHSYDLRIVSANKQIFKAGTFAAISYQYKSRIARLGVGWAHTGASSEIPDPQADDVTQAEITLRLAITQNSFITPSIQYLVNSGFDHSEQLHNNRITLYGLLLRAEFSTPNTHIFLVGRALDNTSDQTHSRWTVIGHVYRKEVAMMRRLYFLFPDSKHTHNATQTLLAAGVKLRAMHAIAREGTDLSELPAATLRQRRDTLWQIQTIAWNSDLGIFVIALVGFFISLFWGFSVWSILALLVMLACFIAGALYTNFVPTAHVDEFHHALAHGEIVLMVDVPRTRVTEIEKLIERRHPEAINGGISWTMDALGI